LNFNKQITALAAGTCSTFCFTVMNVTIIA
jgi:hypothetical protein